MNNGNPRRTPIAQAEADLIRQMGGGVQGVLLGGISGNLEYQVQHRAQMQGMANDALRAMANAGVSVTNGTSRFEPWVEPFSQKQADRLSRQPLDMRGYLGQLTPPYGDWRKDGPLYGTNNPQDIVDRYGIWAWRFVGVMAAYPSLVLVYWLLRALAWVR